jgi:hypothetical protein
MTDKKPELTEGSSSSLHGSVAALAILITLSLAAAVGAFQVLTLIIWLLSGGP